MTDELVVERHGAVLVLTIDRPAARNAVSLAVAEGIAAAVDELDGDDDLRAGVLTGAGGTFCSGMDLKGFLRGELPVVPGRGFAGLVEAPPRKPLVGAVEGWALAGGFELLLACDLVVAAEDARFGVPEVKRSLVAAGGAALWLTERMPRALALEMLLTGEPIDAARAAAVGLVNRLTPPGGALAGALELAGVIAANGPLAVAATKRIAVSARSWDSATAWREQAAITGPVLASEDAREGAAAFAERRPPVWRNR